MGATLENAIVSSVILIVICLLIVLPLELCSDAYDGFGNARDEIEYREGNDEIIRSFDVDGYRCVDTSPERFCTFLTGLSENYRLIYDTLAGG